MNKNTLLGALKSKTMWTGIATVALAHTDVIMQVAGVVGTPALMTGLSVVFMVLRAVTNTSLADKAGTDA